MEFTIPTTKIQMFETLSEIYKYYHFRQLKYDGITLEELNISRLNVEELSKENALEKARLLLMAEHMREKKKALDDINATIIGLKEKLDLSISNEESLIKTCEENYDKAINSLKKSIYESGTLSTSSAQEKLKETLQKKAEEIKEIRLTKEQLRRDLNSQIAIEEERKSQLDEYFYTLHTADIEAKAMAILDEQEKVLREVKRYNNGLDEKEARYRNSLKSNIANLELRYLSIHEQGFAHDELVELGYYDDVIACVSGYYNSLDEEAAYLDIKNEEKLAIYLDSYYPVLVQAYKIRSATVE